MKVTLSFDKINRLCLLFIVITLGCKNTTPVAPTIINVQAKLPQVKEDESNQVLTIDYDTSAWAEITKMDGDFHFDLRYATDNNFTKKVIYDCARCFLRPKVKAELLKFQQHMKQEFGHGVLLFDCYRPRPYQQRLWDIVPDERFVGNPAKGSMHNRGMAVDIALTDKDGNILDFGTDFDHFGPAAFHSADASKVSEAAVKNRLLLKNEIGKYGFLPITSEWWHYSYRQDVQALSDWVWKCP